jgi:hypothetical protein
MPGERAKDTVHNDNIPRIPGPPGSPKEYEWICQFHEKQGIGWLAGASICYLLAVVSILSYPDDGDVGKLAISLGSAAFGTLSTAGVFHSWYRPPPKTEAITGSEAFLLPYSGWDIPRALLVVSLALFGITLMGASQHEKDIQLFAFGIVAFTIDCYMIYRITRDRAESYMVFTRDSLRVVTREAKWEVEWQYITAIYGHPTSRKGDVLFRAPHDKIQTLMFDNTSPGHRFPFEFGNESVRTLSAYDWNCHPNSLLSTLVFFAEMPSPRYFPTHDELTRMLDSPRLSARRRIEKSRIH